MPLQSSGHGEASGDQRPANERCRDCWFKQRSVHGYPSMFQRSYRLAALGYAMCVPTVSCNICRCRIASHATCTLHQKGVLLPVRTAVFSMS